MCCGFFLFHCIRIILAFIIYVSCVPSPSQLAFTIDLDRHAVKSSYELHNLPFRLTNRTVQQNVYKVYKGELFVGEDMNIVPS